MNTVVDMIFAAVLIGLARFLGLLWLVFLLAGLGQVAADNGFLAILLIWVAIAGVKDE